MKNFIIKILCLTIIVLSVNIFIYSSALADEPPTQSVNTLVQNYKCPDDYTPDECLAWSLNQTGGKAGYGADADSNQLTATSAMISQKIGQIISYVLAFLGVLFLVISIMAGLQWMTAGGSEEKIKQAKTRLISAVVGIFIVIMAYAITWFVISRLQSSVNYLPPQAYAGPPCTQQAYNTECLTYCEALSLIPTGCLNTNCLCN